MQQIRKVSLVRREGSMRKKYTGGVEPGTSHQNNEMCTKVIVLSAPASPGFKTQKPNPIRNEFTQSTTHKDTRTFRQKARIELVQILAKARKNTTTTSRAASPVVGPRIKRIVRSKRINRLLARNCLSGRDKKVPIATPSEKIKRP